MRRFILSLLGALLVTTSPSRADEGALAFAQPVIEDTALASMRGGFLLPNGMDIAVAVQSDTRVNGLLLLRSVFVLDKGAPQLSVFGRTDGASNTVSSAASAGSSTTFSVSGTAVPIAGASEGLQQLNVSAGGVAVAASGGTVTVEKFGAGNQVTLAAPTLDVNHLAGQAYGSVVANRGNDVAIDTVTNINIDLKDSLPFSASSALFRVDALIADSATRFGR